MFGGSVFLAFWCLVRSMSSVSPCLPNSLSSYRAHEDMKISRRREREREIRKENSVLSFLVSDDSRGLKKGETEESAL